MTVAHDDWFAIKNHIAALERERDAARESYDGAMEDCRSAVATTGGGGGEGG